MNIQNFKEATKDDEQNQEDVSRLYHDLIDGNQVHLVRVQQEGEYLNINIKIKLNPVRIEHKSDNLGQNIKETTPITSTQLQDNTFNDEAPQNDNFEDPVSQSADSITYESFEEQLVLQKQNRKENIQSTSNSAFVNNQRGFFSSKVGHSQLHQSCLRHKLKFQKITASKLLAIFSHGEQRLITFILPKGTVMTVHELLDQVGIKITKDTNIEFLENSGSLIDYIVKVGTFDESVNIAEATKVAENQMKQKAITQKSQVNEWQQELVKVITPSKFINGYYSVCPACGFHGLDLAKCYKCHRVYGDVDNVFPVS